MEAGLPELIILRLENNSSVKLVRRNDGYLKLREPVQEETGTRPVEGHLEKAVFYNTVNSNWRNEIFEGRRVVKSEDVEFAMSRRAARKS